MRRTRQRPVDTIGRFRATPEPPPRLCDHPGCDAAGEFRAPKDRSLSAYWWFCLDHVRAYNAAWNYYAGMAPEEIEAVQRQDTVWQRPTWRWSGRHPSAWDVRDDFDLFEEDEPRRHGRGEDRRNGTPRTEHERALAVFDLTPPITPQRLKQRYIELVKANHPDHHGGDRQAEERLKTINNAYAVLRDAVA